MRGRKMKMSSTSSSSSSRSTICDTKVNNIFFLKKYFYLERDMFGKPGTVETKSETNYTEQIQFLLEKKNADCQVKYTSNDLRELNDSIKAGRYEKRLVEIEYKYDHLEFIYRFVVAKIRKLTFR